MEFIVQICLTIELNLSLIDVDHLEGMLINQLNAIKIKAEYRMVDISYCSLNTEDD